MPEPDLSLFTDDELEAECRELVTSFKLEILPWTDPRHPDVPQKQARATCVHRGDPYELALIISPRLSEADARRTVLEGAYRTFARWARGES